GSHEPVLRIKDGDSVVTSTVDARGFDGAGTQAAERGNPQTGPFYVEGAAPGDTLAVTLDAIVPNREHGFSQCIVAPNVVDPEYVREMPEPSLSKWRIDPGAGVATLLDPPVSFGEYSLPLN